MEKSFYLRAAIALAVVLTGGAGFAQGEGNCNGDFVPDGWYLFYGLDPCSDTVAFEDPDGDGLITDAEFSLDTDPTVADTDEDGFSDGVEYDANTDPRDPRHYPGSPKPPFLITLIEIYAPTSKVSLEWNAEPGKNYAIDFSTSMKPGSWVEIAPSLTGLDGTTRHEYFENFEGKKRGFWRVRELAQ